MVLKKNATHRAALHIFYQLDLFQQPTKHLLQNIGCAG